MPTAAGYFDVQFNQTEQRSFSLAVAAPANTVGRVCLPKLGLSSTSLRVGTRIVVGGVEGDYVCAGGLAPAKGESELRVARGA